MTAMKELFHSCLLVVIIHQWNRLSNAQFPPLFDERFKNDFKPEDGPWVGLPYGNDMRPINRLCPFTDICSTKLGYEVDTSEPPCCMGCSCEDDCGVTENCCYPGAEGPDVEGPDAEFKSCVYPVTKVYDETLPIHRYTMIDRCPGDSKCDNCGNHQIAEWGSLHPVYSNKTGLIYKNQICAECYNVTDGQIWEAFQLVNLKDNIKNLPSNGHLLTSKVADVNDMIVRFLPPEGVNLERHACFLYLVDYCLPKNRFHIFNNLTDSELCRSGLYAPYFYKGQYYANIFCALCIMHSNDMRQILTTCVPQSVDPSADYFMASIDKKLTFNNKLVEGKLACNSGGKICTDVLCPIGHQRMDGECVLLHKNWFHKNILVTIEFSPKYDYDRVTVDMTENVELSISFPLEPKWRKWTILLEQEESNTIAGVYVELLLLTNNVSEIMDTVSALVKESQCAIQYFGATHIYVGRISKYAYFDNDKRRPLWKAVKDTSGIQGGQGSYETSSIFIPWVVSGMVSRDDGSRVVRKDAIPLAINRLFFCEQVELQQHEFVTFYNGTQMYQNQTGMTYLDGEFLLIEREDGSQVARVCLENSGYHVMSSGSANMAAIMTTIGIIAFVALFLCMNELEIAGKYFVIMDPV